MPPEKDLKQKIKSYFSTLSGSYKRLFSKDSPDARVVLKDLARFCKANTSTFHPDPYVSAQLEGRRETWLHIMKYNKLTADELYDLYKGPDGG